VVTTKIPVTIDFYIDAETLWQAIWGAPKQPFWIDTVLDSETGEQAFVEGTEWQSKPRDFIVVDLDGEASDPITIEHLAKTYVRAIQRQDRHCGSYKYDYNDPDACFGELLLQQAVYGNLIWA